MSADSQNKKVKMSNSLEQLKALTVIVADTGDFEGKNFSESMRRQITRRN